MVGSSLGDLTKIETATRSLYSPYSVGTESSVFDSVGPTGIRRVCLVVHGLMGQGGEDIPARIVTNTFRVQFGATIDGLDGVTFDNYTRALGSGARSRFSSVEQHAFPSGGDRGERT